MSVFEAVFLRIEGLEEREIEFRSLSGGTLDEASSEAIAMVAPEGANLIKILAEGHLARKIGIGL
jgi:hypothetical protein